MKKHVLLLGGLAFLATIPMAKADFQTTIPLSLPAGYSLIANPLSGERDPNRCLIMPENCHGARIHRFDPAAKAWRATYFYLKIGGVARWMEVNGTDSERLCTLAPGEGAYIFLPHAAVVRFSGQVHSGYSFTPVLGGDRYSLLASPMDTEDALGHDSDATGPATGLAFPARNGDVIYLLDNATNAWKICHYVDGRGWLGDCGLEGPMIAAGTSFWLHRLGPGSIWEHMFPEAPAVQEPQIP